MSNKYLLTGLVHDAVLQWAYGVNTTVEQGFPPDDGLKVTENIINMTFEGILGKRQVDHLGNWLPDYR